MPQFSQGSLLQDTFNSGQDSRIQILESHQLILDSRIQNLFRF